MQKRTRLAVGGWLMTCWACSGGGGDGQPPGGGNPGASAPTAPTNLTVDPGNGTNTITWTASAGATSHNLYHATSPGVATLNGLQVANVTSPYQHDGLTNGETTYYVVTAVNAEGESPPSIEAFGTPKVIIDDPLYSDQWHLENLGQLGGVPGEDANVRSVLEEGLTGVQARMAIVDDGLEIGHEDLASNIVPGGSFNYVDGSTDPTGGAHGTSVAGVAAADGGNGLGVIGAAPGAELVGYNFLAEATQFNEAHAMSYNAGSIAISNNSWGVSAGGNIAYAPQTWYDAVGTGLTFGRGGLGTIYMFAGGNDGEAGQDTNDSAYSNHPYVITVAAVGNDGKQAVYSEPGAPILISAPSGKGDGSTAITTTDRMGALGYTPSVCPGSDLNYTPCFSGTSSATPLAAGCVALVLEANTGLGWRDVRKILAYSARVNDPSDSDWTVNGAGYAVNHKYGFGVVDAQAAVDLARTWTNLGDLEGWTSPLMNPGIPIPDDGPPVSDSIFVSGSGIAAIESVQVLFSAADHPYPGDLEVWLTSPSGTASLLARKHPIDTQTYGLVPYDDWVFTTVRHLDESADGTWTLSVRDTWGQHIGTFEEWQLSIVGV